MSTAEEIAKACTGSYYQPEKAGIRQIQNLLDELEATKTALATERAASARITEGMAQQVADARLEAFVARADAASDALIRERAVAEFTPILSAIEDAQHDGGLIITTLKDVEEFTAGNDRLLLLLQRLNVPTMILGREGAE